MNYRKLCEASRLKEEMVNYLRQMFNGMSDGENMDFEIEGAIYWFAADYHQGQSSELYNILSTSEYNPGMMEYSPGSENASDDNLMMKEMYQALEERFGGESRKDDSVAYRDIDQDEEF